MTDVLIGWPGGSLVATGRVVGVLFAAYLLLAWAASVLWVYRDVRSRSSDATTQLIALGIAVIFPIAGLPLYLVLRPGETMQEHYDRQLEENIILSELHAITVCPNCRRPAQPEFIVCAHCATPLQEACQRCGRLLNIGWRHCPYCAAPRVIPRREPAALSEDDQTIRRPTISRGTPPDARSRRRADDPRD